MNEIEVKKILLATGLYPPDIGGPATYALMLENQLPKHVFELDVLPFGEVRRFPKGVRHMVYAWRLWRHAATCDVIYALDPISVGLPALLVSKLSKKPLMVRLGGDYAWEQGQQRFGVTALLDEYTQNRKAAPWQVRVLASLQSNVVQRAKRVIVPSQYMKSIVTTWDVSEDTIRVIYSALFPLSAEETKENLRTQLNYTHPTIVSAGRLVPWKGFKTLISVIKKLKETYPDVQLIIAGEGVDEELLKEHTQSLGLFDSVRFVGRLSKEALGGVKKAADVFVLNTAYEGLSHELLEVMDLGVPIVTTGVGGNLELIENGVSGLLVDFDDEDALETEIKRVIENEQLQQSLTQHARLRTKDFEKEKVVAELSDIIKNEVCTS